MELEDRLSLDTATEDSVDGRGSRCDPEDSRLAPSEVRLGRLEACLDEPLDRRHDLLDLGLGHALQPVARGELG